HARSMAMRAFGFVMPVAMAGAVVMTANHWVIDVVAGGAVALTGLALATMWEGRATGPDRSPTGRRYHAFRAGTHPRF
ncbi:MAG: phosphatase PAP2 family protein, partial [Gaiellales bacterium]